MSTLAIVHARPHDVTDARVLHLVQRHWDATVIHVEHVAVGFGAWHWRADTSDGPALFLSLDPPEHHDHSSLESAYACAAALGLPFVHAPLRTRSGRVTVPLGERWLSATPWLDGSRPAAFGAEAAALVRRVHAAAPPAALGLWSPAVGEDLIDELSQWTSAPWTAGPLGEAGRSVVRDALPALARNHAAYLDLCRRLDPATYVVTHGEPDVHNQWRTADGRLVLLDWESILLAPRERDLLGAVGDWLDGDPALVRLFRIEWQLSEVRGYAQWLRAPHRDDADLRTALDALREETGRDLSPERGLADG